jgi:hypothetical protein
MVLKLFSIIWLFGHSLYLGADGGHIWFREYLQNLIVIRICTSGRKDLPLKQYTVRSTILCQWRNNGQIQSIWRIAYSLLFWSHVSVQYQKEHLTGLIVVGILRRRIVDYSGNKANREGRTKLPVISVWNDISRENISLITFYNNCTKMYKTNTT